MKVLFLSRWFPYPADNGSKIRIFNLLKGIAARHELTLVSFYDPARGDPDASVLETFCKDVRLVPWKEYQPDSLQARLGLFSLKPRVVVDTYNPIMQHTIAQALDSSEFDAVIVSEVDMAAYTGSLRGIPAIFEDVEVGILYSKYALAGSTSARLRHGLTWLKHRRYIASVLKRYPLCTVVSPREAELITRRVSSSARPEVIPNCVDLAAYQDIHALPVPGQMVFTGSFTFFPNYQAMLWFLGGAFEKIRSQAPEAELVITGNHANMPLPVNEGIHLTGLVPDVRPYIARAWCSVVPLQIGGGTRLKILEAMALCTPVVTTSMGAEGLDVQDGVHLLIADDPDSFAAAVIRLVGDPTLRNRIAAAGFDLVKERYNWAVVMPRFLGLIDQVAGARHGIVINE